MEPVSTAELDLASLKNKNILITGGASGIGLAVAKSWANAGASITISDLLPKEQGDTIASGLGQKVQYIHCDVTSWSSQLAAFKAAVRYSSSQTLDVVATFAGTALAVGNQVDHVLAAGPPDLNADLEAPNTRNIDVNLTGLYYTSWLALYFFRLPQKEGHGGSSPSPDLKSLILVSSIGAYMDSPKASTYPASKFGVRGLFRSTRSRTLDIGVRCNMLAPWFVDTPLIAPVRNGMAKRGLDMANLLGFASMESCVEAATYLAVENVHGRAIAVQPEGIFDLKDDLADGWGGDQLRPIMQRRKETGFDA